MIRFTILLLIVCLARSASAQPAPPPAAWNEDPGEKLMGLMNVWGGVKYAFPHVDRLEELDWDARAQACVERVLDAEGMDAYYAVLMELVAALGDSHTMVLPPWGYLKPGYDIAPIETRVLDGRFYVDRVGDGRGFAGLGVVPGAEILTVDGIPVREHFEKTVLRLRNWGADHANAAGLAVYLLYGPAGGANLLSLRTPDGRTVSAEVVRDAMSGSPPFMTRQLRNAFAGPTIRTETLAGDILYVAVPNFEHDEARIDFETLIDGLADRPVSGMVLDLRWNMGGSNAVSEPMVACLIDEAVPTPTMRYRHYVGAHVAWGRETIWEDAVGEVRPREGNRYGGPLVVLVNALTNSSAEDFALELRAAGRARLVGHRTAGGAGNALRSGLPGGGTLRVATFTALTQEGEEYVGQGIEPDVVVSITPGDLSEGRDTVLDRALELLQSP